MLSAHSLLIAAIFTAYMLLMLALGLWIARTGRHPDRDRDDGEPALGFAA